MGISLIAGLTLAALSVPLPADLTHRTQVAHRDGAVDVTYHGKVDLAHHQRGAVTPPGVAGVRRCDWTGTVSVSRHITRPGAAATLSTIVAHDRVVDGSRHGDCLVARKGIERDVAAHRPTLEAHMAAVAARDRASVLADLDAAAALASR
ncbi:hypothetical protein [Sphingomonas solaris]|uniref:DUF922 domain-containing protein n=1 Tax=Alterirhizorhabdus solaris TaxID=2529389 RepID=A0A558QVC2_9SPHN|nr:hypothetical protein [Sphingomonas solaris]TVV71059.1 hypothetical protein FOY91_17665 [Sphingomonas solaris]